jgi:hypothetical protein
MFQRFAFPILATLLVISPFVAAAARADRAEIALLGRDPGTKSAYACFVRHYDAAHMAGHPKQNVRDISMFVSSTYQAASGSDPASRTDNTELGFSFKGLKRPIYASGDCSVIDGEAGLTCSIDCDGGSFNVTTTGTTGAAVGIPNPISMWDPEASDDGPPTLPKAAVLGADDKSFALDRVDLKQCGDLMTDDAKADIFGTKAAAK